MNKKTKITSDDKINEAAFDIFGDILLEDVGGAYGILEDYIDQI